MAKKTATLPDDIPVEKYEPKMMGGKKVSIFAITEYGDILIPEEFEALCTNAHLLLRKTHLERPSMFGLPDDQTEVYLPMRTGDFE